MRAITRLTAVKSWTSFYNDFQNEAILSDPNTTNPTVPYLQITNPSLAFDHSGDFYILIDEHNAGGTSGAIVLQKYKFTTRRPSSERFNSDDWRQCRLQRH